MARQATECSVVCGRPQTAAVCQAKWLAAKCQMVCGRPQAAACQRRQSACSASLVKAQVACEAPPPARPPCRRRLLPATLPPPRPGSRSSVRAEKRPRSEESGGGVLERVCKARGGRLEGKGKGKGRAFGGGVISSARNALTTPKSAANPREVRKNAHNARTRTYACVPVKANVRVRTVRTLRCALADRLVKMASCTHARER